MNQLLRRLSKPFRFPSLTLPLKQHRCSSERNPQRTPLLQLLHPVECHSLGNRPMVQSNLWMRRSLISISEEMTFLIHSNLLQQLSPKWTSSKQPVCLSRNQINYRRSTATHSSLAVLQLLELLTPWCSMVGLTRCQIHRLPKEWNSCKAGKRFRVLTSRTMIRRVRKCSKSSNPYLAQHRFLLTCSMEINRLAEQEQPTLVWARGDRQLLILCRLSVSVLKKWVRRQPSLSQTSSVNCLRLEATQDRNESRDQRTNTKYLLCR